MTPPWPGQAKLVLDERAQTSHHQKGDLYKSHTSGFSPAPSPPCNYYWYRYLKVAVTRQTFWQPHIAAAQGKQPRPPSSSSSVLLQQARPLSWSHSSSCQARPFPPRTPLRSSSYLSNPTIRIFQRDPRWNGLSWKPARLSIESPDRRTVALVSQRAGRDVV